MIMLAFDSQVKLADPDVVSNPSEYQKLAQSVAELDEVLQFKLYSSVPVFFFSFLGVCVWNLWLQYTGKFILVKQVVSTFRKFKDYEKQLGETKGMFPLV